MVMWLKPRHRLSLPPDVELEPGCGVIVTCMVLILIAAGVTAACIFGAVITWRP